MFITTALIFGQKADTIQFKGFKGVLYDSLATHAGIWKISYKKRFNPTITDIQKVESELIPQYGKAIIKHHNLLYEDEISSYTPFKMENLSEEEQRDLKWIINYKKTAKKSAEIWVKRLKKEYQEYDRSYYGYIGRNGMKYIRIDFTPHKEKWVDPGGVGEGHLYNLPPLVYNLDKNTLSLSGWTGEKD